jgi:signal transduction histidine kinase
MPDLVLMDIMLKGQMNGIEAAAQIHSKLDIPIIYLTAYTNDAMLEKVKATEPFSYLIKPFKDRELKAAIEISLNKALLERKLKETVKIKSEFTSMVSHELRTPLTAIKEGIALVLDEMIGDINEEQKELLAIAKKNVDRLARLIGNVLDFQKLEAGMMEMNIKPNNINKIAEDVYATMLPTAKEIGLDMQLEIDDNLPQIRFDNDKITQVLMNLVSNAVKFTNKGTVTIRTAQDNNSVSVSVSDTGIGIKEEDLPKVFNKFEQLGTGGDRQTGGSGLGLAISNEIIGWHKGKIRVESNYGTGSTFTFTLPKRQKKNPKLQIK